LDDSIAPEMKTIDEELAKWTGVDDLRNSIKFCGNIAMEVGGLQDIE
jgi:hypothetical protein